MQHLPAVPYGTWFRRYRARQAPERRLVCFPHAGGSASFYRNWPHHLPAATELLAVRYPGREDRFDEPYATRLTDVADEIGTELAGLPPLPVTLFGHSMGAAIAYEVAARLEHRHGLVPQVLVVSGRRAPHLPRNRETVHLWSDDDVVTEVHRLGGVGADVLTHPELRALFLPMLRADYRLIDTYRPEPHPPLSAPLTALSGTDDPSCPVEDARGWSRVTTGAFALHALPGDHFFLIPAEAEVARLTAHAHRHTGTAQPPAR